jgi:hypothetical protein
VLGELKDGTSYLHDRYKSITGGMRESGFEELVKREGVRIGLKYGVASEWTSFVAVVKREENVQQQHREREKKGQKEGERGLDEEGMEAYHFIDVDAEMDDDDEEQIPASVPLPKISRNVPVPQQPAGPVAAAMMIMRYPPATKYKTAGVPYSMTGGDTGMVRRKGKRTVDLSEPSLVRFRSTGPSVARSDIAMPYTLLNAPAESSETGAKPLSPRTKALIDIQTYDGSFELDSALAALLGVSMPDLEAKLALCFLSGGSNLTEEQKRKVWATVFAIKVFEIQLAGERDVWGLVVDKASAWVRTMMGDRDVKALEKLVGEVLGL